MDENEVSYPYVPIGAEARGKVRAWRQAATTRYRHLNDFLKGKEYARLGDAYASKRGVGRERVWRKLRPLLTDHGAHLQWTHTGQTQYAIFAVLCPGPSLATPGTGDRTDLYQDSVHVQYLVVGGRKNTGGHSWRGLWSLEVPDHALARLVQRDRNADITQVILEAHNAALWMPHTAAPSNMTTGFNLPAGTGVFLSRMFIADHPRNDDDIIVMVRPWTWLHHDQLTDLQEKRLVTRAPKGETMGETLLLPKPFYDRKLDEKSLHF